MPERAAESARLVAQAAELGVTLETRQADRLLDFRDLLQKWNRAFNLVSRRDVVRLVPRHLLDSLSVAPWLVGREVLDVGTGAGFPGIPLAIAREDAHFTLVDISERKIRFIRRTVHALSLGNVAPHCSDVTALDPACRYDTVVSRAVADPAALWQLAGERVRASGRMVVMARAAVTPSPDRPIATEPADAPSGDARPAAAALPLPLGARLEGRRHVRIPGLAGAHELLLLRHRESGPTVAGDVG